MITFSFSQYSTFMQCPKKFYWAYERNLIPAEMAKSLAQGIALHEGAAGKLGHTIWQQIGEMAAIWFGHNHPLTGIKSEVEKTIELAPGINLKCIADAVSDDCVIEYKSTSRADTNTYDSLSLSLQNRLYVIVFEKPKFVLRIIKKPAIRQKKTETPEDLERRLFDTIAEAPQDHFLQIEIPVVRPGTISELMMTLKNINNCQEKSCWPMAAPYNCYGFTPCPYLKLCSDEQTYLPLFKEKTHGPTESPASTPESARPESKA